MLYLWNYLFVKFLLFFIQLHVTFFVMLFDFYFPIYVISRKTQSIYCQCVNKFNGYYIKIINKVVLPLPECTSILSLVNFIEYKTVLSSY